MKNRLTRLLDARAENLADGPRVSISTLAETGGFPLVISPKYAGLILTEWIRENRGLFDEKLHDHGAILLRGFQIDTVEKFRDFINVFEAAPLQYRQRSSPRYEVAENIYHSTTYPEDQHINMHSENSYSPDQVRRIVFCCIQPAGEQGETPIADNRMVVRNLTPATRLKFLEKGIKYVRNISKGIGLSWEEVFQTEDKGEVEKECTSHGMEFRWDHERLILSWNNSAIISHPDTHEEVWFNHAFFFNKYAYSGEVLATISSDDDLPFNTFFGDGSEISSAEIEEIRSAYEKASVIFPWKKGDVLFLDNMLISHGRRPYKGERKVIVSMF